MNWRNESEILQLLSSHGFEIDRLDLCHRKRYKRTGHDQKGWLSLYEHTNDDGTTSLIGAFGYWIASEPVIEKISPGFGVEISPEKREAIKKRMAEINKQNKAEEEKVRQEASRIATVAWNKLSAEGRSEYLERKGVEAKGIRFFAGEPVLIDGGDEAGNPVVIDLPMAEGDIAIPAKDIKGVIWGLQIIRGKKRGKLLEKQFWPKGMRMKASHHVVGIINRTTKTVLVAEGYATAMTLHAATGLPVVVAFYASNLMPVSEAVHKQFPRAKLLICADDDYLTDGNPGVRAAQNAATAVGGNWIQPIFPFDRQNEKLTDFNDLANSPGCSLSTVTVQIDDKLRELAWGLEATPEAAVLNTGEGGERKGAVSIMELDELVERFIFIDDVTGDFVFDTWTHDVCKFSKMTKIMAAHVEVKYIKQHPVWQSRAVYVDQIGFDPGHEDPHIICNRWRGWPMKPKQGDCSVLLDLLRYLCSKEEGSDKIYEWVIKWLAYPLQHAGAKMHSAIVMHGDQGTGKSMFFEAYAKIFGEYAAILNQGALDDKFNSDWAEKKQFVIADEVAASSEKYQLKNQLKTLITGEWVRVNPKNVAAHRERNHMNLVFLSNEAMPVVLENDDRRHLVIRTPPVMLGEWQPLVLEEIANGGVEALYSYLLGVDLTGFDVGTKPPYTEAKGKLIYLSAGSDERFLQDWKHGYIESLPFCPAGRKEIYEAYKAWCKQEGENHPRPSKDFFATLSNRPLWRDIITDRFDSLNLDSSTKNISWRVVIPSEKDLQEAALLPNGEDFRQKPGQSQKQWLTECYYEVLNRQESKADAA